MSRFKRNPTEDFLISLEDMKEANGTHTPEMKHFMGLEKMNRQMEIEYKQREQGLHMLILKTHLVVKTEHNVEVEKLKKTCTAKVSAAIQIPHRIRLHIRHSVGAAGVYMCQIYL